jgi:hypothetical protein
VLAGTWEALFTGQADLAIGVVANRELPPGVTMKDLGPMAMVFVVAPHHPLAAASEPLDDCELVRHRVIAVADSAQRLTPMTVNILAGQDVLTVSDISAKIDALLRSLGCGFVPERMARDHIAAGRLVVKEVQRNRLEGRLGYAWRTPLAGRRGSAKKPPLGLALRWWLEQLESETTRKACSSATAAGSATGSGDALRRSLRALAHRPAACGSLVAALASWLDARAPGRALAGAHRGPSTARATSPGAARGHSAAARTLGPVPDEAPVRQSARTRPVRAGLARLMRAGRAYACGCSGATLALAVAPEAGRVTHAESSTRHLPRRLKARRALVRLRTTLAPGGRRGPTTIAGATAGSGGEARTSPPTSATSCCAGPTDVWAYQLAVVVDDAAQGITDVVRGEDLAGNTARQILLQRHLGMPTPRYLHTPLVLSASGEKLSKQTGAKALDLERPLEGLGRGGRRARARRPRHEPCRVAGRRVAAWRTRWPLP